MGPELRKFGTGLQNGSRATKVRLEVSLPILKETKAEYAKLQ